METVETSQPVQPVEPKSTNWPKIILATVLGLGLLAGSAYAGYYYGTQQAQSIEEPTTVSQPTDGQIPSLPKTEIEGICHDRLKYKANFEVKDETDARKAFQKYVGYMRANNLQDENLFVDWQFIRVEYAGYYKDLPYWVVTYHGFMASGEEGNAQTHVNRNGEIVQLLGCI